MISTPHPLTRRLLHVGVIAVAAIGFTACGGSDSPSTSDTNTSAEAEADTGTATADESATPIGDGTDESPIGIDDNGELDFSEGVDDAIDAVGLEGLINIVADQLDPKPTVEIDGNTATLTFSEGTLGSNAWLPCSVVTSLISDGQTVTVVYPDGSQVC